MWYGRDFEWANWRFTFVIPSTKIQTLAVLKMDHTSILILACKSYQFYSGHHLPEPTLLKFPLP